MDTIRLVIISVPSHEIRLLLEDFILKISEVTGAISASQYPPHITLRTGVVVPVEDLEDFFFEFSVLVNRLSSFTVRMGDLIKEETLINGKKSFFIGYNILPDNPLVNLNSQLLSYTKFRKTDRNDFRPHLSIAYNDLTSEGFDTGCDWIETHPNQIPENLSWTLDYVALYQFNSQRWVPLRIFSLGV